MLGAGEVGAGGGDVPVAGSLGLQVDGLAGQLLGQGDDLVQGGVGVAADVDGEVGGLWGGGGGGGGVHDVSDEGEVAPLAAVPVQAQGLAGGGGVQGTVDEHVGALARAVDGEVAQGRDGGGAAVAGGVGQAELFLGELGHGVGGGRGGVVALAAGGAVGCCLCEAVRDIGRAVATGTAGRPISRRGTLPAGGQR